jgi:nitronate monooxygenase
MPLPTAFTKLLGIEHPLVQAPMAGASTPALAAEVSDAGGLGSLACALLGPAEIRAGVEEIRARTSGPLNVNFFAHRPPEVDAPVM